MSGRNFINFMNLINFQLIKTDVFIRYFKPTFKHPYSLIYTPSTSFNLVVRSPATLTTIQTSISTLLTLPFPKLYKPYKLYELYKLNPTNICKTKNFFKPLETEYKITNEIKT